MSILIKGMQMPDNCSECQLEYDQMMCPIAGRWYEQSNLDIGFDPNKDRLPECPLVELPEHHGRLFDQDDVKAVLYDMPDTKDKWDAIALLEWAIDKRWCIEAE